MGVFERVGRFAARRRWWVVGAWALLGLVALPLAPQTPGVLQPGGFSADDLEAARARRLLEDGIGLPTSALVIVIEAQGELRAGDPAFESAVIRALARVPAADHVTDILSHTLAPDQVSKDGRTVYEVVSLDLSPDLSPDALSSVQNAIADVPGLTIALAGGPAFYGDIQQVSEEDLRRSEIISLPLAALALLLVFGSVVAAGVPIVVGGLAVLVALAAIYLIASMTPMSIFVLNLATLLGFGLGVDYALLLASRFREELAGRGGERSAGGTIDQEAVTEAVAATVATAGRAVFFSGVTVLVGLCGLVLFDFMVLRSVGIAGAIVVGFAVLAALTLLPAVLAILGPRLDSMPVSRLRSGLRARVRQALRARVLPAADRPTPSALTASGPDGSATVTRASRHSHGPAPLVAPIDTTTPTNSEGKGDGGSGGSGFWWRLGWGVMERPVRVFVPTLVFLVALGVPFLHVRLNAPDASILPAHVPSRAAYETLLREFQVGDFAPLVLAIRTHGPVTEPQNVGLLYDYSRRIAADPRVKRVGGIVDIDPRLVRGQYQLILSSPGGPPDQFVADTLARTTSGDLTAFTVVTWYGGNDQEGRALVHDLRDPRSPIGPLEGLDVLVGGGAAEVVDVVDRVAADFPRTALFIVLTTYLILFVLLRSVILPAKALVMNTLSITASFGALVWIFQDGNLSAILGFTPLGFVETTLPVILFCVLFGLSMDYEVFLLTRMKEAWDSTGDNRVAVARGLERSGRIVSSAALIVVVVAGSFSLADVVLIKALGLGVALAVALDATVVRALLVPSTMRLLGRWNWWMPTWLTRLLGSRLPVVEGAALVGAGGLIVAAAVLLSGCTVGAPILANGVPSAKPIDRPGPASTPLPDPRPVVLPRDDGPHDRLTEWWYDTGHLVAADGRRFGFEFVIFRAERGSFPVIWASHLAMTDEAGGRFLYDQRSEVGPQVDRSVIGAGFDLAIGDDVAPGVPMPGVVPWTMTGAGGVDHLAAAGNAFGIDLRLDAGGRPAALHDRDGYVDFGPAGGSYYYSRTRLAASGSVTFDGVALAVTGEAWFDHQWGDFISVGGGGWDWFAVNLDGGTDITLSLVRAADGTYPLVYGTLVQADGTAQHLERDAFTVTPMGTWTSPATGATYPAGWSISVPAASLTVELRPTVAAQELDTRSTTGVVYWEGSQVVTATRAGQPIGGEAYVELTGYGPGVEPAGPT
jgi:putative drug exporter of the RND superfamily